MSMRPLSIIVATDLLGGFARDGQIPWKIKEDMKHFKDTTAGGICIMGRKTYEDIVARKTPAPGESALPGRQCYVISRDPEFSVVGAKKVGSLIEAVSDEDDADIREIFVIGGEFLYREALPFTETIYMTIVNKIYECDKFIDTTYIDKYFDIAEVSDKDGNILTEGKSADDFLFFKWKRNKA